MLFIACRKRQKIYYRIKLKIDFDQLFHMKYQHKIMWKSSCFARLNNFQELLILSKKINKQTVLRGWATAMETNIRGWFGWPRIQSYETNPSVLEMVETTISFCMRQGSVATFWLHVKRSIFFLAFWWIDICPPIPAP